MGSGTGIHKGRRKQLSAHIPAFCFLTSDTISSAVSSSCSFAFLVRWTAPLDQFFHSLSCFCKIILSQQQKRNKEEDDVGSIPGWENLNPRKTWCLECSREVGIPENYGLGLEDWEGSESKCGGRAAGQDGMVRGGRKAFSVDILLGMHCTEQGSVQWVSFEHMSGQTKELAHYFRTLTISCLSANPWVLDLSSCNRLGPLSLLCR